MLGPDEPRPDLCIVVGTTTAAASSPLLSRRPWPAPFERLFGTPHGTDLRLIAQAAGLAYTRLEQPADLAAVVRARGLRVAEVRTDRAAGAALRRQLRSACESALHAAREKAPDEQRNSQSR